MDNVIITKCMVGLYSMQVCVAPKVTDEEILEVCNRNNPTGTSNGWSHVEKETPPPVSCLDHDNRTHYLVDC